MNVTPHLWHKFTNKYFVTDCKFLIFSDGGGSSLNLNVLSFIYDDLNIVTCVFLNVCCLAYVRISIFL